MNIKYRGKIIAVVDWNVEVNGTERTFEKAVRAPGVRLIILDGDKILLTKEYRYELKSYDYRLPGGKVVDTLDEYLEVHEDDIEVNRLAKLAAIREAREEVGLEIYDPELVNISKCGATIEWDLYYYEIKDFKQLESQQLEEGEDIESVWLDKNKVKQMCLNGDISEERSAMMLLKNR